MLTTATRVFRLPDLGEGLTEAALVQWLVKVGDTIRTDQPIAEVETAKSVVELPSPFAGKIMALHGVEGSTIDVGSPVLEVLSEDDVRSADADASPDASTDAKGAEDATLIDVEKETYREEERAGSGNVLIGYGTKADSGSGRRRRRAARAAAAAVRPPAARPEPALPPAESVSAPADHSLSSAAHRTVAVRSPLVRRLARDLGVDTRAITPTGADGSVTRADVLQAAVEAGTAEPGTAIRSDTGDHTAGGETIDGLPIAAREPLSMLRKAVSATLSRSRAEIPEATVWVDVDATNLWNLRSAMAPAGGKAPSITAILARYVLLALEDFPLLASRLSADGTSLIRFDGVNLGVAADTPRGLMVPVVTHAHRRSIAELDGDLRSLAKEARAGTLPPDRLRGSTFTLNNYGGFGVDGSAAIINHPEVAILGIGRIIEKPWVVDGEIVARRIAQLSLVFDHRVCDGGYAAGFLRRVVDAIEQPLSMYGRI